MENFLGKIISAAMILGALYLSMWIAMKIRTKLFGNENKEEKTSRTQIVATSVTTWLLNRISKISKDKKFKMRLFVIATVVLFIVVVLFIQFKNNFSFLPPTSFKNEPTGFRKISFRASQEEFLRLYPNAQLPEGKTHKDLMVYFVENERFLDWDNIVIRFIFFKNRLYTVAIDYTPLTVGSDFDTERAEQAADLLMLTRAKEHYGTPEIQERDGIAYYIWRGRHGGVTLDQHNNTLSLIDSQLLLEYQAAARKYGP